MRDFITHDEKLTFYSETVKKQLESFNKTSYTIGLNFNRTIVMCHVTSVGIPILRRLHGLLPARPHTNNIPKFEGEKKKQIQNSEGLGACTKLGNF